MAAASQRNSLAPALEVSDNRLVRLRMCLRKAIDKGKETGWTYEAIAVGMRERGCHIDAPYISKLLSGEKPITDRILDALPDEIEGWFAGFYAECFNLIVVPRLNEAEATRALASGLFSILTHGTSSLPEKAGPPAKAELRRRDE